MKPLVPVAFQATYLRPAGAVAFGMSARQLVSLNVAPHVHRFVFAKCGHGDRVHQTSCGLEVWATLSQHLRMPVASLLDGGPPLQVEVVTHRLPKLDPTVHSRVNHRLEQIFRRDMCLYVDFMRQNKVLQKKYALIAYLEMQGIAPDDHYHVQSAVRVYWQHERRLRGLGYAHYGPRV